MDNTAVARLPGPLARGRLRDAAVAAVQRGWPVVPGSDAGAGIPTGQLRPAWLNWEVCAVTDAEWATQVWDAAALPVLLVCGRGVDAMEVPWSVCELLGALAGASMGVPVAPVAETGPSPRWLLFAATGTGTVHGRLAAAEVRLLGEGQWVALPRPASGSPRCAGPSRPRRTPPTCCPTPTTCRKSWWMR